MTGLTPTRRKKNWERGIKTEIRERRGEKGWHGDGETHERETSGVECFKKGSDSNCIDIRRDKGGREIER